MNEALNASVAAFTIAGCALAAVALWSWARDRRARTLWLAAGFLLFAAAGLRTAWGLFAGDDALRLLLWQSGLGAAGLLLVYLAAVKR